MKISKLIPQPRSRGKYASKRQRLHNWIGWASMTAFTLGYAFCLYKGYYTPEPVHAQMISPVPSVSVTSTPAPNYNLTGDSSENLSTTINSSEFVGVEETVSPTPTPVGSSEVPTKEEVESFVKQVFRGNSKLAYAVAMVEGYPKGESDDWGRVYCWYRWDEEKQEHKGEYSVGIFQINIIEGCNGEGDKVHYDRIPGANLEEKVKWLSNPFNNIIFARMLTLEQSGFGAWTGYTNGNYKDHL